MAIVALRSFPLAYHITLQAYGNWLPGDPRGWHARGDGARTPPRPGNEVLHAISRERQRGPTVTIVELMAMVIMESIARISRDRGWTIHLAVVVGSHLHVVVTAATPGVVVIGDIRSETTLQLVDRGLHDPAAPFWSAGGYFSVIRTAAQLARAIEYVARHRTRRGGD